MSGRVRLAVVGCGAVVERLHLAPLKQVEDVEVCALVDRDEAATARLARLFPRARRYRDTEELPREVSAALVAVPSGLHATVAEGLLKRGIHVLCEKPMATTLEDCRAMVGAAAEAGATLMIGHQKRFVASVSQAKRCLEERRLGRIIAVSASMGMPAALWPSRTPYLRDPALAGGGVLLDSGVHLIDLVLWLLGPLDDLRCTLQPARGLEDEARVEFTVAGAPGLLRFSRRRTLQNVFRIDGEDGFLEFDTYDYPALKVASRHAPLCRALGGVGFEWPAASGYEAQLRHFVRFVRGDEAVLLNPGVEAMRAVEVVLRAYEAAR
jgi:predicted dehydrogenase